MRSKAIKVRVYGEHYQDNCSCFLHYVLDLKASASICDTQQALLSPAIVNINHNLARFVAAAFLRTFRGLVPRLKHPVHIS